MSLSCRRTYALARTSTMRSSSRSTPTSAWAGAFASTASRNPRGGQGLEDDEGDTAIPLVQIGRPIPPHEAGIPFTVSTSPGSTRSCCSRIYASNFQVPSHSEHGASFLLSC